MCYTAVYERPLLVHWSLGIFYSGFALIVAFAPHWLATIDALAAPWHAQVVFVLTFVIWFFAALRLRQTWQQTGLQVDGVMALIAAWFTIGTISLHAFEVWRLSWWLYHGQLLLGVITAVWALSRRNEKQIHVESQPGEGSTFSFTLPTNPTN